ncbi:MAG TPA: hypothetical protein VG694_03340 [Candidatus Paceibacterota bacterium]|nr:hypothetical protein [Candidatus Paceibacterota bacterium]
MQWLEVLKNIGAAYKLTDEQNQTLGTDTMLVMLGIIDTDEYETMVNSGLGLDKEVSGKVYAEINQKILLDILPELNEIFRANLTESKKAEDGLMATEKEKSVADGVRTESNPTASMADTNTYQSALYEIGKNHKLNIEQMGILERVVKGITEGTARPEDFQGMLTKNLNLSAEDGASLAGEINEKVFKAIRQKMMQSTDVPVKPAGGGQAPANLPVAEGIAPPIQKTSDSSILKSAGIEIMPQELPGTVSSPAAPASKLSDPFKIPAKKTEYNLNQAQKPAGAPPQKPVLGGGSGTDPYRMPIE